MKILDIAAAAEYLGLSKGSIYTMADSGKLPAAKIGPDNGRHWVFTEEGLEEYLREEIRQQTAKRRKEPVIAVVPATPDVLQNIQGPKGPRFRPPPPLD